jgi:hypothetical protein
MKGKGKFILVRQSGFDELLLSRHTSKETAERAMRKLGGEPESLCQNGMRIVSSDAYEVIEVCGKQIIRPLST